MTHDKPQPTKEITVHTVGISQDVIFKEIAKRISHLTKEEQLIYFSFITLSKDKNLGKDIGDTNRSMLLEHLAGISKIVLDSRNKDNPNFHELFTEKLTDLNKWLEDRIKQTE